MNGGSLFDIDLSVVIVNYRTPTFVIDCLATLLPEVATQSIVVVVVDNHSGDNSMDIIREWVEINDRWRQVRLVQSTINTGFAGGNNLGIRYLRARQYLLLNSDTLIRTGAIARMLSTAAAHPEAGVVSPRLEWPDGTAQESCFRYPTPVSELMRAAQTGIVDAILRRFVVALPVQTTLARPQWTTCACVLVRHEVFEQVGLLDEGYFMYFEDVELCHRIRRAGWDIVHEPAARIVHLRGGSSPVKENSRRKKRLPRYYYESRTRLFYQLYGRAGLTLANLSWWLGRLVSGTRQLLGRKDKAAIEGQWRDIWINWRKPLRPYTLPQ